MPRSARRPEPEPSSPAMEAFAAVGGMISKNPALVGGSTAFLIALSFVSANAVWYQPHAHTSAFFSTRTIERADNALPVTETTIHIERPAVPEQTGQPAQPQVRQINGDPVTKSVQAVLKSLNFYAGEVDGLSGPGTRRAVEAYQKTVGLPVTGMIDQGLLSQLDVNATAGIPDTKLPAPKPQESAATPMPAPSPDRVASVEQTESKTAEQIRIRKIQAGLRAFGAKDIEIDGVAGARTRAAIGEFQALFGLKKTGEPDKAVYAKMQETGFVN